MIAIWFCGTTSENKLALMCNVGFSVSNGMTSLTYTSLIQVDNWWRTNDFLSWFNPLSFWRCGSDFKCINFRQNLGVDTLSIQVNITVAGIIAVTSKWARWCLKSPTSRLFAQSFIQEQIKENIKAPRHWSLLGEFTGDRWIPRTKGQ